jgi:hypothetical protein
LSAAHTAPCEILAAQRPVDSTQYCVLRQAASLVHGAMQAPFVQTKLLRQSESAAQLTLHAVPEQMRLFAQVRGTGTTHTPVEQVPGSTALLPEHVAELQVVVGQVQALVVVAHLPLQAATPPEPTFVQSVSKQQAPRGMHLVPQGVNPPAHE